MILRPWSGDPRASSYTTYISLDSVHPSWQAEKRSAESSRLPSRDLCRRSLVSAHPVIYPTLHPPRGLSAREQQREIHIAWGGSASSRPWSPRDAAAKPLLCIPIFTARVVRLPYAYRYLGFSLKVYIFGRVFSIYSSNSLGSVGWDIHRRSPASAAGALFHPQTTDANILFFPSPHVRETNTQTN